MTDWNIQSRAHTCSTCARGFADKECFHTLLYEERAELRRLDLCQTCWDRDHEGARERKGFVSYWHGVYEAPPPVTEAIQKETAESLLRKLIELNNPQYIPAGYILAVMLERKRILRVKEQIRREGKRVFIYEHPKSGDVFTIIDPDLQLTQLEQVQKDVAHLLEHGIAGLMPVEPATDAQTTPPQEPVASNAEQPVEGTPPETAPEGGGTKPAPESTPKE
jgi:hypothetical protein